MNVNTPACSGSTEAKPWRSFTAQRMSCITARAKLPATAADRNPGAEAPFTSVT